MENLKVVKFLEDKKLSSSEFEMLSTSLKELEESSFHKNSIDVSSLGYEFYENPYSIIYLYYVDDKLVGYLDYWVTFDSATIFRIGVDSNVQNKGIGSKLMNKMFEDIKNNFEDVYFISLEVRETNVKAQALYKKFEFSQFTKKVGYYGNEDALVMGRGL